MLAAPLPHLLGESGICEFGWPGGSEDDEVAVGIGRGEIPGVPWRIGWPVDRAATVRPGAFGTRVDLVVNGREAQRAPIAWRDHVASRSYEQILELPPPQVDQHKTAPGPGMVNKSMKPRPLVYQDTVAPMSRARSVANIGMP
jgi:hypothetical protein